MNKTMKIISKPVIVSLAALALLSGCTPAGNSTEWQGATAYKQSGPSNVGILGPSGGIF
jgi:hypothetical protein